MPENREADRAAEKERRTREKEEVNRLFREYAKTKDIAIRNKNNPEIKPETLEKAYRAKERAIKDLAEERSRQHEQRKRNDRSL